MIHRYGRWDWLFFDMGETMVRALAAGDVNRDGRADLVVQREGSDALELLINVGTGEITDDEAIFAAPTPFDMGVDVISFILEDLNGDHNLDIAALSNESNQVTIRLGLGDGQFSLAAMYTTGDNPVSIATTRSTDGAAPDLITANRVGGEDYFYLLHNTSTAAQRNDDCNRNRRPDSCDISDNPDLDSDGDGVLDSCPSLSLPGLP